MDDQIGIKITFILDLLQSKNFYQEIRCFREVIHQEMYVLIRKNTPVIAGNPDQREKILIGGVLFDRNTLPAFEQRCMDVLRNIPCITNIVISTCSVSDVYT